MATKKIKLTGFARFLLVMVILTPLAFLGASYYNGQDGFENLKNIFKGNFNFEKKEVSVEEPAEVKNEESKALINTPPSEIEINSEVAKLQDELNYKTQKVDSLYKENASLKAEIEAKDKELIEVKKQLDKVKSAFSQ